MKLYLTEEIGFDPAEVVGIFDMDAATVEPVSRSFLKGCEQAGETVLVTGDVPNSFVLTSNAEGEKKVYFTRNAPKVLSRRIRTLGLK